MNWESSELDIKWAENTAENWMYMQGFAKSAGWTAEDHRKERNAVAEILLFGMRELGVHVRQKPSWYADELEYNIPVEID